MRLSGYVLAGSLAFGAWSPACAESINGALAAAYNHNSELNLQRAATRVADEQMARAKSGYRPTITGDADWGFVRTQSNRAGTSVTNPYGYGITVSQNLFDGFQTLNNIAVAEASIRGSREQLRRVEQTVLQSAATAYVDVLRGQELVSLRKKNLAFLSEQLRSSQARLDVGEGTRTDVAQSRAEQAAARATVAAAIAQLEGAKATYFQLIGRRPSNLRWPKGPTHLFPGTLQSALAVGANQHPAVRLAIHSKDASSFAVKVQEGRFLPTLALQGNAQQRYNSQVTGNNQSSLSAQLRLTVPIYQGGAASSAVREAKESLAQARINVDVERDKVRAAVVQAWASLNAAKANVSAGRAQVKAGRLALEGIVEERNVGQRTQLDVLIQQSSLLQAQINLLDARKAQVDAGYALVAAIGRLTSRTLRLNVRHYRPEDHYKAVKDLWYGLRTPTGN